MVLSLFIFGLSVGTSAPTAAAAGTAPASSLTLPSSGVPTDCIDYQRGHRAELEFVSLTRNVQLDCAAWIAENVEGSAPWTNQRPEVITQFSLAPVCSLVGERGAVSVSVVDSGHRTEGRVVCQALERAGWSPAATAGAPRSNAKPTGSTRFLIPKYSGGRYPQVEPAFLDFSGDAGNVVENIRWSLWSAAKAIGVGRSILQSCEPNCAAGAQLSVATTITLLDPAGGHFTELLEERNGTTSISSYTLPPQDLSADAWPALDVWPAQAG